MSLKKLPIILFWIVAIAMPVGASLIAIAQFQPNIEIPMHWNAHGEIDRYGTPWEVFPISLIMSGCNVLLALSYVFSNKLYDLGFVHGISRKATRPFLCGTAIVMVLVWMGILAFWLQQVIQASS